MTPRRPAPPPPLASYRPASEHGGPAPRPVRRGPPPPGGGGAGGGGPRRGKPRRKSSGLLTGILYLFLLVAVAVGGGVGYLILNPPSDFIRDRLSRAVKDKTGRDLIVAGPAGFSFWPGLGVRLKDVTLSGPPGSANALVTMAELDVNIKTMPLINRQVELRRLIMRKPVFDLRIDKSGAKNWDFAERGAPVRYAQLADPGGTANDASPDAAQRRHILPRNFSEVEHVRLEDVRIEDGTVRYTDERAGTAQEVKSINVTLALKSLQSPITANGDLAWKGEKIDFNAKVTSARAIMEEQPALLVVAAQNRHIQSTFDGRLMIKDGADVEGKLMANSGSLRGLAQWLGTELPQVSGFGPLSIAGQLKTNGNVTSLNTATFGLDGATATGNVEVTTGGARPYVRSNLKISELDLNKYLTTAVVHAPAAGAAPADAGGADLKPSVPAAGEPVDEIEKLLESPATKVYGYEQREGWSSEPFDLALLGVIDTDSKLHVGRLLFNDLKIGQSVIGVALKNRVLKSSFDEVLLYDGHGKGFLNIDGTGNTARIGGNLTLDGISALPFLKDAADMSWLSGKAKMGLQIATAGSNQLQVVQGLNGKADFTFNDGAIVGFNLAGAIRGISQGNLSGLKTAPSEKTDFSEMSASFAIANGVATNQDLNLVGPLLRVTGAGTVNLPPKTLDYTMKPKIVASLEGQGRKSQSGIEVPLHITGSWDRPKITPDLNGLLANPDQAVETVKQLGKQFKGKNANEILDGLLGKGSSGGDGATGSSSNAKNLLNKFLNGQ